MSEDKTEIIETDELYDLTDDFDDEDEHKFPLFLKIIGILVLLFLCVLGGGYYYYMSCQKAIQKDSEIVMVEIPENSYFRDALDILEKEGLIKDANIAYYYARFNHLTNTFAGNYELDKNMDLKEILTILNNPTSAKQETLTVKIIDGEWCKNIAESLAEVTGIAEEEFTTLWNDKEWIRSQMEEYPFLTEAIFENPDSRFYLEGYLAPDTYLVLKDASAEEITKTFLDQTLKIYQNYEADIQKHNLSTHELFSFASLIQFEAGNDVEEQKRIAGVLYNRLDIDMLLQCSASVCYAIDFDKYQDHWMECESQTDTDSPYNTYMYPGIQPGPICNFNASCLDAVLHPEENDYLYFVADVYGDGAIHYAKTLEEHEQNVYTYLTSKAGE